MTLPPLDTLLTLIGLFGGTLAVMKVGWAVAGFFIGLSKGLENLTSAVEKLAKRFDTHTTLVTEDITEVRHEIGAMGERVASLEAGKANK